MVLEPWILRALPPPGSWAALDILMIAASTVGFVGIAVGVPWWLMRRDRALGRTAVGAMGVGLLVSLALQLLVLRPRPVPIELLLPAPPLPSFPSGHAVLMAVALVVLGAHRRRLALALAPLAGLVALSRVYVGHHHLSDVVGGLLLGLGLALGMVVRLRAGPDDPWRLRWVLWPQVGLVLAVTVVAYTGAFSRGDLVWLQWPGMDKVLHFGLFGFVALGMHFALRGRTVAVGPLRIPLAIVLPLCGAIGEELVQGLSPHRTADPFDLLADLLGLILFAWIGRTLTSTSRRPKDTVGLRTPSDATPNEKLPAFPR